MLVLAKLLVNIGYLELKRKNAYNIYVSYRSNCRQICMYELIVNKNQYKDHFDSEN